MAVGAEVTVGVELKGGGGGGGEGWRCGRRCGRRWAVGVEVEALLPSRAVRGPAFNRRLRHHVIVCGGGSDGDVRVDAAREGLVLPPVTTCVRLDRHPGKAHACQHVTR